MPDPTPDDGICTKPLDEKPSEVIVTTESRTLATTPERSASGAAVGVDAAAAAAATGGDPVADASRYVESGPVTNAAVPATASTADRTAAARMDPVRRPEPRETGSVEVAAASDPVVVAVG